MVKDDARGQPPRTHANVRFVVVDSGEEGGECGEAATNQHLIAFRFALGVDGPGEQRGQPECSRPTRRAHAPAPSDSSGE